jgi:hypothetical protein
MKAFILAMFLVPALALAFEGETEASVSVSGTNARTSADLSTGIKEVDCTVAVYYRMGTSAAVATTNDAPRSANTRFYVNITNDGRRLAFITSGGTGTCRIYPVNVLATSRAAGALIFGGSGGAGGAFVVTDAGDGGNYSGSPLTATVTAGSTCVCSPSGGDAITDCTLVGTTLSMQAASAGIEIFYVCVKAV